MNEDRLAHKEDPGQKQQMVAIFYLAQTPFTKTCYNFTYLLGTNNTKELFIHMLQQAIHHTDKNWNP